MSHSTHHVTLARLEVSEGPTRPIGGISADYQIARHMDLVSETLEASLAAGEVDFVKWHGLATMESRILASVTANTPRDNVNGWAVLALVLGVGEISDRLIARLDTFSVICGLLLTIPLGHLSSAADGRQAEEIQASLKYSYTLVSLLSIEVVAHFGCIVINCLFSASLRAAARDSDRWRLLVRCGNVPGIVDTMFTIGNVSLTLGISTAMYATYGILPSVLFSSVVITLCAVSAQFVNAKYFKSNSHVVAGWKTHHFDEFDLRIPIRKFKVLCEFDRQMRNVATNSSSGFSD